MSDTQRVYIRKDSYYGGDVYLEFDKPGSEWWGSDVTLRWRAYGGHGEVTIVIDSEEADLLADAIRAASAGSDDRPL